MRITLLEPFLAGSHAQWAEGYRANSRHEVTVLGMPGRHWKWRMHGGALTLAQQYIDTQPRADLLLATDMLDLGLFLGLTRRQTAGLPVALYFHENQLAYPWSPTDPDPSLQRDNHYAFINFSSALAADRIFFNSAYNRDSFLSLLPGFLSRFPDHQERRQLPHLQSKCAPLPLGLDLKSLGGQRIPHDGPPLILWNHRWEHDKGPEAFFAGLRALKREGASFRLCVLGAQFGRVPACFDEARQEFQQEIVHWGYAESRAAYAHWLRQADYLPVTGTQDFFGASVVEAIYCGVRPLLPQRLAYPEHIPSAHHSEILYRGEDWVERLRQWLVRPPDPLPCTQWVEGYDWAHMAPKYDDLFEGMLESNAQKA